MQTTVDGICRIIELYVAYWKWLKGGGEGGGWGQKKQYYSDIVIYKREFVYLLILLYHCMLCE